MRTNLLVYDDGSGGDLDLKGFVDSLDEGAEMLTLDGHVCFIRSGINVAELSDKFEAFAGSRLFFIVDITNSDYSGRMLGVFWKEFMRPKTKAAAE